MTNTTPPIPKILSLDGGDIRGLSLLLILREIMEDIERTIDVDETAKPSEYFDLIEEISTDDLITIMLDLLGMIFNGVYI